VGAKKTLHNPIAEENMGKKTLITHKRMDRKVHLTSRGRKSRIKTPQR